MMKKRDKEPTEIEKGLIDLKEEFTPKSLILSIAGIFLCSVITSGLVVQSALVTFKLKKAIVIVDIFKYGLKSLPGLIMTILLIYASARLLFWFKRRYKKDYSTDRERNYHISKQHSYGMAGFQEENEIKKCFFRSEDPNNIYHNLDILGRGIEDGMLYSLRDDLKSMNGHMCIMGSSGAGKSAAFVKNKIYQGLKRGNSMIVTDSKGDLYADTAKLAHDMGYKVRMLNLKSDQLMNSDGCDFLKTLNGDDTKAQTLAETIIKNTEGTDKLDYFAKNELNLLKSLILYVATKDEYVKNGANNLAELYNIVSTKSVEEIETMMGCLDDSDPAKQSYNIFKACEPKVQGQILNGMAIRLQILSNKWAKKIVSSDEIDLVEPMKSRCIYYVVISDTETAYKFIATLFFADLFIELCSYYDRMSQYCNSKNIPNPCIPVDFILDEYANTGAIPDFNVKVATVRSRQIGITIILQDIGQLKDMYGDNLAYTILNNMPLKMLLKTSDPNTAKYFSDLLGVQTIRVEQRKYHKKATTVVEAHDEMEMSEGIGKRQLMNPDELINDLDPNHLILCISGFHPVKLKKFLFFEHPMSEQCKFIDPARHTPKWRKKIDSIRAQQGLGPIWQPTFDLEIPGENKPKKKPVAKAKPKAPAVTNNRQQAAGHQTSQTQQATPTAMYGYGFDEVETPSTEETAQPPKKTPKKKPQPSPKPTPQPVSQPAAATPKDTDNDPNSEFLF